MRNYDIEKFKMISKMIKLSALYINFAIEFALILILKRKNQRSHERFIFHNDSLIYAHSYDCPICVLGCVI